jgi:hypothetical protein
MKEKKPLTPAELNKHFSDSKTQLNEHLAEARTNVNLFAGNHFHKQGSKFTRSLEQSGANAETKIRVTKNHTNTICKHIINSILNLAPTGVILPKNPSEIQDQKAAEIHSSILEDFKYRNKLKSHIRRWVHDYVINGEVFVNQFWDPSMGQRLGQEIHVDPETGEQSATDTFEGDVVLERIWSWDVRQDPAAKSFEEAAWIGYEKMLHLDKILKMFGDSEEIRKACQSDMDETYKVFDSSSASYKDSKGMILLRQMYFRPCLDYPQGYFVFFTKEKILAEGPLPTDSNGNVFFPIKHVGFDEVPTSARSVSIIRQIRPDQMEVNRCASAIALTQMTVGFDKMIAPTGGEIQADSQKAGIRIIRVPGGKQSTDIIPGRNGDQFLNTMTSAISEMYSKTGVPEQYQEKTQDADMLASLYKNERQKVRYSLYADKFSDFLIDIIETTLKLKKAYMPDGSYIRAVGKAEFVNIAEFRAADDIGFQIKVEPGTDDLESRYGKHMALTNMMQYLGGSLDKTTTGMVIKNYPFSNIEEISSQFTKSYDNAKNIMLALDRGENPPISAVDDADYIRNTLNNRMRKPDFQFLDQRIQAQYHDQLTQYNNQYTENMRSVQRAEQGFIPFDGPMVPVEGMYETVTGSNGQPKSARMQLPQVAIKWLADQLKAQGQAFGDITNQPLGLQANVANQFMAPQQGQPSTQGDMSGNQQHAI